LLLLIFFADFSGLLGQAVNGTRRYEGPIGGKTDRATMISLGALAVAFKPGLLCYSGYFIGFVCIFVILTAINRLRLIVVTADKKGD